MNRHILSIAARSICAIALSMLAACSGAQTGTIQLITGEETDTFTLTPVPSTLTIDTVGASGAATTFFQGNFGVSMPLPDISTSGAGAFQVRASDANANVVIAGASLPVGFGALAGVTFPIYVQRTAGFARLPSPANASRAAPLLAVVANRYVVIAGGGLATTGLYDLLSWASLPNPPTLPRVPLSMATFGTVLLLIDDTGATEFDLSNGTQNDVGAPSGGAFADVAGGATIAAPDGSSYIIGGTRSGASPTASVLRVDPSGLLSFASLTAPRLGAAAAWAAGEGLVVAGGSSTGAGVELLAAGASTAVALAYAPDATAGAGAAALDASHVLLAGGGSTSTRIIDLGCAAACAAASYGAAVFATQDAELVALDSETALLVGDDATGATEAMLIAPTTATAAAFKVPHMGARALALPTGEVLVAGGAPEMETYAAP